MHVEYLMGNEAIALGAIRAGVDLVAGYPGTPSSEILETVAKHNDGSIYVEWSVNEKAAMEVAAGAALCGAAESADLPADVAGDLCGLIRSQNL